LPGTPDLDGEIIGKTDVVVSIPEMVREAEIRLLDDGKYTIVKDGIKGTGETMEDAIKQFKKAYKAA